MSQPPSQGSAKTGSEELARQIRERREQLGMSRQELAEVTGVPYPTIAQIETAYRGVSPSRLGVIARALGLDPAELYDILASDASTPPAETPRRARAAARSPRGKDWQPNPAYAQPAAALMAAGPEVPPPAPDVVEQVVALLSELPAHDRLDTLGRVQSRLLAGLVHDEVSRATRPRPRS